MNDAHDNMYQCTLYNVNQPSSDHSLNILFDINKEIDPITPILITFILLPQ